MAVQLLREGGWSGEASSIKGIPEEQIEDILRVQAKASDLERELLRPPPQDLFEGCLVGVAIGDTLGLGVEMMSQEVSDDYVRLIESDLGKTWEPWTGRAKSAVYQAQHKERGARRRNIEYPVGQISDDTQCSVALAKSIVDNGGIFSPTVFSTHMVALHTSGSAAGAEWRMKGTGVIGQGPTSKATLDALASGKQTWLTAAGPDPPKRATNGSVMRVGPLGLVCWHAPSALLNRMNAVTSSHVTVSGH
jgi:ADP-ribosylglycohydrolase